MVTWLHLIYYSFGGSAYPTLYFRKVCVFSVLSLSLSKPFDGQANIRTIHNMHVYSITRIKNEFENTRFFFPNKMAANGHRARSISSNKVTLLFSSIFASFSSGCFCCHRLLFSLCPSLILFHASFASSSLSIEEYTGQSHM